MILPLELYYFFPCLEHIHTLHTHTHTHIQAVELEDILTIWTGKSPVWVQQQTLHSERLLHSEIVLGINLFWGLILCFVRGLITGARMNDGNFLSARYDFLFTLYSPTLSSEMVHPL